MPTGSLPLTFKDFLAIILRFFRYRGSEILLHQAPLLLGIAYGWEREGGEEPKLGFLCIITISSLFLFFLIYLWNDWCERDFDRHDPYKPQIFASISSHAQRVLDIGIPILFLANALASLLFLGKVGIFPLLVSFLGFAYSTPGLYLKGIPFIATLAHFFGALAHFFWGYTSLRSLDLRGLWFSLFFGVLFSAGHITQDLRDLQCDEEGGIRTLPNIMGARKAFLLHFLLMTSAFLLLGFYAIKRYLPLPVLALTGFYLPVAAKGIGVWQREVTREEILGYQRFYRLCFFIITLVLLAAPFYP